MKLHGAENGKARPLSEPLVVYVVEGEEVRQVNARFRYVPPRIEHLCRALAEFYQRTLLGRAVPDDIIDTSQHLLMISWALRIDDGSYTQHVFPFPNVLGADNITLQPKDQGLFLAIRDADVHVRCTQAEELWMDYSTFVRSEFPTVATDEGLAELLEDAKKKPLLILLSERGYWPVVRLMRGLGGALRAQSVPGNGSAG